MISTFFAEVRTLHAGILDVAHNLVQLYQPIADANLIVAVMSISCNRLILSLRGLYFKRGQLGTSVRITARSSTRAYSIQSILVCADV